MRPKIFFYSNTMSWSSDSESDCYTPTLLNTWHQPQQNVTQTPRKVVPVPHAEHKIDGGFESQGSMDSEDVEMKDEPTHAHVHMQDAQWTEGDEAKCGCDMLQKILKVFASVTWDPQNVNAPFPNCVILGLSLMLKHVSEAVMDLLLDVLRWWKENNVQLQDITFPANAKKLKRDKEKLLPDMGQFIGLCIDIDTLVSLFWLVRECDCRRVARVSCRNVLLRFSICSDCNGHVDTFEFGDDGVSSKIKFLATKFNLEHKLGETLVSSNCPKRVGSRT